jgi:hypothetical protein
LHRGLGIAFLILVLEISGWNSALYLDLLALSFLELVNEELGDRCLKSETQLLNNFFPIGWTCEFLADDHDKVTDLLGDGYGHRLVVEVGSKEEHDICVAHQELHR